jgi:hypothetical protein
VDKTIVICKDLTWRDLNGELVVLNSKNGDYHMMNEVGRIIWLAMAEKKNTEEIQSLITEEYDVDSKTALNDIQNFIENMTRRGLLTINNAG